MATFKPEALEVSLNLLEFDPENPRLPRHLNGNDERQIINWMLEKSGLLELLVSIATQGYFNGEPLLAIPNGSKYIVIEGNRRLAALKLLEDRSLATSRPKAIETALMEANFTSIDRVPIMVYPQRSDILSYLGYRHVTGIKEWEPLEKARYLEQLSQSSEFAAFELEERFREIARVIGSRVDYVKKLLTGLNLYYKIQDRGFFGIERDFVKKPLSFSLLTTALGYSNIVDFLGLESAQDIDQSGLREDHLEQLTLWMFAENESGATRLGESRNLKQLNAVVANKDALAAFSKRGYTLEAAVVFTDEPLDTYRTLVLEAKDRIGIAHSMLPQVQHTEKDDIENIDEILNSLRAIKIVLQAKFEID